jgi:glycosyltransferase involved in cell wall biosynthesis
MLGDGIFSETLKNRVTQINLSNFTFLSYQSYSLMIQVYAASDICLVPQTAETGCDAIPSKVYRIMACGRPILACTEANSDLALLILGVGCGKVVTSGSTQELSDVILDAYKNQNVWRQMGQAGREHVVKHYARPIITGLYHELIQRIVEGAPHNTNA